MALLFGGLEINVAFQRRSRAIALKHMRGARSGQQGAGLAGLPATPLSPATRGNLLKFW
ncbi:MAG TPA: hypothetical protein VGI74_12085 [Streptosporangiaceae bacterium]